MKHPRCIWLWSSQLRSFYILSNEISKPFHRKLCTWKTACRFSLALNSWELIASHRSQILLAVSQLQQNHKTKWNPVEFQGKLRRKPIHKCEGLTWGINIILGNAVIHIKNDYGNGMRFPLIESPMQGFNSILHIITYCNIDFRCLGCIHNWIVPSYPTFLFGCSVKKIKPWLQWEWGPNHLEKIWTWGGRWCSCLWAFLDCVWQDLKGKIVAKVGKRLVYHHFQRFILWFSLVFGPPFFYYIILLYFIICGVFLREELKRMASGPTFGLFWCVIVEFAIWG